MFERIVWATDGSAGADAALAEVRQVAAPHARIVAVHCSELASGRAMSLPSRPDEPQRVARIGAQVEELREEGFESELVVHRTRQSPADVVAAVAADERAELIVCGSRGHGSVAGTLLGSVSQRLLHVAPIPVLVVPARGVREAVPA
jgi:nucleotide-binding universal stress UspA family protein